MYPRSSSLQGSNFLRYLGQRDSGSSSSSSTAEQVRPGDVSVNLFFTSFAKQARRSRKGGFTGCANVFSPIPVTA